MIKPAVVIIPIYDESCSIRATLDGLVDRTSGASGWQCAFLVVDGNSPDGTADVVRSVMKRNPGIHLIVVEKKEEIGAAYFKGFRHTREKLNADVVIELDGNSQHLPEAVPEMLRVIRNGAALVLVSCRLAGGGYPEKWDPLRLFFSRAGDFLARMILFFPSPEFRVVTDPTTGLKATRVAGPFQALISIQSGTKGSATRWRCFSAWSVPERGSPRGRFSFASGP
jgi:dolichol-phosphate mannosyltransferase